MNSLFLLGLFCFLLMMLLICFLRLTNASSRWNDVFLTLVDHGMLLTGRVV
jgi:hypothetical protein